MSIEFNCYNSIFLLNPDNSTNTGDVSNLDYIDLSF